MLSEFIDADAAKVRLITGDQRTELEWFAPCDYLRARCSAWGAGRLLTTTSAPASPLALVVVSGLSTALTQGWTAALLVLGGPARAAQALRPDPIAWQ